MKISPRLPHTALACSALALSLFLSACGQDTPQQMVAQGKENVAKKDYKSAVIQFKSALQANPEQPEVRLLLGKSLLRTADAAGAVVELSKALEQHVDANQVMPLLAQAMVTAGDSRKLVTQYADTQLTDKAAQADFKSSQAVAWSALGDRRQSEKALEAALAASPEHPAALTLRARVLASAREFDAALALLDKILAKDDSQQEAWLVKGDVLGYAKNDVAGSQAAFRKALALDPGLVSAHTALILSQLRQKDLAGAKAQSKILRELIPKNPHAAFVEAQVAFSEGDFKKARDITQQLRKVAPNHVGVLQLAGAVEGQIGSLIQAETYFTKAIQLEPDLLLARRNLAQTQIKLGQVPKALETLQPLLSLKPPDPDAHAVAGEAYLRLGNAQAAEEQLKAAMIGRGNNLHLQTAMASTKFARGNPEAAFSELQGLAVNSTDTVADQAIISARIKRREYDAALQAVDALLRKVPQDASAHELRGRVLTLSKKLPAAREAFEQALKLDPKLFAATASLAALDMLEKQPEQAQKRIQASIDADGSNVYAYLSLAEIQSRRDAPLADIKKTLDQAIAAAPGNPTPRLQLIELTLRKRQYKEALVAAQEAAAAMPTDKAVLDAVGRAQMEAGDVEQAVSTFRKLAGVDEKSAAPYLRLADVYIASGRKPQAENALRKALEVEPSFLPAQEALVKLMLAGNRHKELLEIARSTQQKQPKSAHGYELEALIHKRMKSVDAALAALRKGLAANERSTELPRALYATLLGAKRDAEADRFAAAWLKDHPDDVALEYQTAVTAITRGQVAEAEQRLARIVAKRPNHPLALNNLAWALSVQGKPGGVAHARRAVELMPNRPALLDTLAMALVTENQADEALKLQKRAVDLSPEDNGLRLNLARIALKAGDHALARSELDRLKALGPDFAFRADVEALYKSL